MPLENCLDIPIINRNINRVYNTTIGAKKILVPCITIADKAVNMFAIEYMSVVVNV